MAVSAVIRIEQFQLTPILGSVRNTLLNKSNTYNIREDNFSKSSNTIFHHLYHVSIPAGYQRSGWATENKTDWSDGPTKKPLLLYRHRFGFGRDRKEIFDTGYGAPLAVGQDGQRWGTLDDDSGILIFERDFPISSKGEVRQFKLSSSSRVQEKGMSVSSSSSVHALGKVEGDVDVVLFPFLIFALPKPFSSRNPVDTDVFIRISNYAHTIAPETIVLYLDGVLKTPLQIVPFFGGLGGFDVTWLNDADFDYDDTISVKWEFFDTDVPPNKVTINYSFDTAPDLAPPRIINLVPQDGITNVSIGGPIQFDVVDFEVGVDISTLILYVNNVKINSGVNGLIETFILDDESGYTVRYTPFEPWLYGDIIPVAIFVKDLSEHANEGFFAYRFTTTESSEPRLLNMDPAPCDVLVPVGSDVSFDVVDGGHGLNKDSIEFTVDGLEKTGPEVLIVPVVHRDD